MKHDKNLYPYGLTEIFYELPDECRNALIGRRKKEISDYIYQVMFDDNDNPEADMLDFFRNTDFGVPKLQKGGLIPTDEYETDTNSILDDVRGWSELAANVYLSELPEENRKLLSKQYVGKIISRFVLEQVAEVVNASHDYPKPIANIFFRMLPKILDAHTKPSSGGFFDSIIGEALKQTYFTDEKGEIHLIEDEDKSEAQEEEFEPWFSHNPWETLEKLRRECIYAMEKIREYESTSSPALRSFLIRPDASLPKYDNLKSRKNAVQMIANLDEKIRLTEVIRGDLVRDSERARIMEEESEFVDYLVNSLDLHEKIFDQQVQEMERIIESADPKRSPLDLLKELKEYTESAPRTFWIEEIMSGKSSVEKFDSPEVIKDWIRLDYQSIPDIKKYPKERAFVGILCEMRGCSGFNDRSFDPLAEMLVAQQNGDDADYWSLAGCFAFYVARKDGDQEILQGMEKEDLGVKCRFLKVLDYNAEHELFNQREYEQKLRKDLMAAGTEKEKMALLESAQIYLSQSKLSQEKMIMIGE